MDRVRCAIHVDQNGNLVSFPDQTCIFQGGRNPACGLFYL
jgi:hypothetical protein